MNSPIVISRFARVGRLPKELAVGIKNSREDLKESLTLRACETKKVLVRATILQERGGLTPISPEPVHLRIPVFNPLIIFSSSCRAFLWTRDVQF